MDKQYNHQKTESKIYSLWEKGSYFTPKIPPKERPASSREKKQPFTILLPPPNANDPLHMGHALFVVEDILCRYHRMLQEPTLFLPGTDHAGIETQYVFEKRLATRGKSRFDFDRKTLFNMINNFVEKNRGVAKTQMKQLGFSLDWTRERYTLDPDILKTVMNTFNKLHQDGLIYRDERIVNYCTHCGTAFSELEVVYKERKDPLYYLKYGPFTLATVRPETKFGDTAVAVNPHDARYRKWIGQKFTYQSLIGPRKMKVIADNLIDPDFGTGVVKVTPAHDPNDFDIAQRHQLQIIKVIDLNGKLNQNASRFAGLTITEARKKVVGELEKKGDLVKVDQNYTHRVGTCYRCKNIIEPMLIPQWYVKIEPLAKPAIKVVKEGKLKIVPARFKKLYLQWLENIKDWNISRQIVWGPRIPAWYCLDCNPEIIISFITKSNKIMSASYKLLKQKHAFEEIEAGLQTLTAPKDATYQLEYKSCPKCQGKKILQETDTFDTWFSSGQWPLTTLGFPDSQDFTYFYPTSVLDTMWDILFFWVSRMVMFGLYRTGKIPFRVAHMHCRVVDEKGQKMSKSRGNIVNPIEMVEKYGADALRMALVFGTSPGSDFCVGDDKVRAMRNFTNKVWNIGRFIISYLPKKYEHVPSYSSQLKGQTKEDKKIIKDLNQLIKSVTDQIEKYRFDLAAEKLYHFLWHRFADQYLESAKERIRNNDIAAISVLRYVYLNCLKLLHPFMPFVTEDIWSKIPRLYDQPLVISKWPKEN
ncbi:MAG TPA: valine--tRNA ligase [Candidatus Bathyarchaeia archaeon]|nr:valine--tRNA ligase [Candidatus Bathyarchaeia archaeon]